MMKNIVRSDEAQTARAGLLGSIAGLISFLSGTLLMPVISQLLPADALGRAVSYNSTREIVFLIMSLSIAQSVSLAMIDYQKQKAGYLSSIFLFAGGIIVAAFLFMLAFKRHIIFLFYYSDFLFYWFFLMLFLQLAMEIVIFYTSFHNKYIISFCIVLLTNTLAMLMSIFLITTLDIERFISRIIGMDSYVLIIGLTAASAILIKGRFHFQLEHIKYGLRISIPLIPYMISSIFLMRSDILVMSYFNGDSRAGVYSMAFTIANILFVVLQQLAKSWSPWVYRKISLEDIETVRVNSKHFLLLAFLAAVCLMAVMPELVRFFIHSEYHDSVLLVCPLIIAMYFRFLNLLFYDIEYFNKKNMFNGISHAVAAAVNLLLDILLIRKFGFAMCAVTTALCYGALTFTHYLYARSIEKRVVYDLKCMLLCSVSIAALGFLLTFTLNNWLIRYGALLAVVSATLYYDRELVLKAAKKITGG